MDSVFNWMQAWATVISGLGSVALTFGLVYLYWKQQKLLKRELNREVRENHTRTLHERIRAWHGDMDEIGETDIDPFSDDTRLPKVRAASVQPAPPVLKAAGQEPEFRVIPEIIENDRYLHDLLENHADDLNDLKQTIEKQYTEFDNARRSFIDAYPEADTVSTEDYVMKPMDEFPKWVFEQAVILHRDYREKDKNRLQEITESSLEDSSGINTDTGMRFYSPVPKDGSSTYKVIPHSGNYEDIDKSKDEVYNNLARIHSEAIDGITDSGVFKHTVTAAQTLDEMEETVQELKAKLVEHEGHPVYTEDCEYIEKALV